MWDGISELGLDLSKTSLFLTHLYSDHTGLVWDFVNKGIPVYMSKREISYQKRLEKTAFETLFPRFRREGFPDELLKPTGHGKSGKCLQCQTWISGKSCGR